LISDGCRAAEQEAEIETGSGGWDTHATTFFALGVPLVNALTLWEAKYREGLLIKIGPPHFQDSFLILYCGRRFPARHRLRE
jgi:hypothetical protein